jgi:hypothetical protein
VSTITAVVSFIQNSHTLIPVGRAADLKKWGWNDANTEGRFCQFDDSYYDLEEAFQGAGFDPHAVSQGGHNQYFHTEHWDHDKDGGPNRDTQYYEVDGKSYRVRTILAIGVPHSDLQLTR